MNKKVLSFILAILILLGTVVPVMATTSKPAENMTEVEIKEKKRKKAQYLSCHQNKNRLKGFEDLYLQLCLWRRA